MVPVDPGHTLKEFPTRECNLLIDTSIDTAGCDLPTQVPDPALCCFYTGESDSWFSLSRTDNAVCVEGLELRMPHHHLVQGAALACHRQTQVLDQPFIATAGAQDQVICVEHAVTQIDARLVGPHAQVCRRNLKMPDPIDQRCT